MEPWERDLTDALRNGPEWPGRPQNLWQRILPRLKPRRHPWYRRWPAVLRSCHPWLATTAAAAASILAVTAFRPAPPVPAAVERPALEVVTRVLEPPAAGGPVRFGLQLGTPDGGAIRVDRGRLEIRSTVGDLVWETPIPGVAGRELTGRETLETEMAWPAAEQPGHYRVLVRLEAVAAGGGIPTVTDSAATFFVPYPAGSVRSGQVAVGRTLTRGPVAATLERVGLAPDHTSLHFTLDGAGLSGGFQWQVRDAAGLFSPPVRTQYRVEGSRLVGVAQFEPTLVSVPALLVRLERVGLAGLDDRVEELPYVWEWQVDLDP